MEKHEIATRAMQEKGQLNKHSETITDYGKDNSVIGWEEAIRSYAWRKCTKDGLEMQLRFKSGGARP